MEHAAHSPAHTGHDGHDDHGAHATNTGVDNRKFAMWTLIGSECFLFGSMIGNYIVHAFRPQGWAQGPKPTEVFNLNLTTVSTFVLLMSSVAMVFALHNCNEKKVGPFRFWTALVVLGGLVFLGGQVYEFMTFVTHDHMGLTASPFASAFFLLTGCHGAHVFVGVMLMATILIRSLRNPKWFDSPLVETLGLYWHFVDVIWILIFTIVYLFVFL